MVFTNIIIRVFTVILKDFIMIVIKALFMRVAIIVVMEFKALIIVLHLVVAN